MTEHVIIEIRAGEGGKDAQKFVGQLAAIYEKFGARRGL